MKLRSDQLTQHLNGTLQPVYLVWGDDPLLTMEACDLIRQAAHTQGISERQVFHAESGFDWNTLREENNAMSLFSERRILEVRIPNGKPSDRGNVLFDISSQPNPDNLLLIQCPKLDAATQKTKWYKAIEKSGVTIPVWPIDRNQYPGWLNQRLRKSGLQATPEAIAYLAQQTEGNLLSAVQEIEKLKLSGIENVTLEALEASSGDHSRYDAFSFVDCCLLGDVKGAQRMLMHLKAEGTPPLAILGALMIKLRMLSQLINMNNSELAQAFKAFRIWPKQQPAYKTAVANLSETEVLIAFQKSELIDKAAKGSGEDPWKLLSELTLLLTSTQIAAQIG